MRAGHDDLWEALVYFAEIDISAPALLPTRKFEFFADLRKHGFRAVVIALISCACMPLHAWHRRRARLIQANVRFIAASTLLRSTVGRNEDSYLAEFSPRGSTDASLIRLIDVYPAFAPPLSRETLTSKSGTGLRLRRDPVCDIRFGDLLLRAAPGDLIAILPVKLVYRPPLDPRPASGAIIPCYRTARN